MFSSPSQSTRRVLIPLLLAACLCPGRAAHADTHEESLHNDFNARVSILLFPSFTPLLTLEARTLGTLTVQFETNFWNTHGFNLKYFAHDRMDGFFGFFGGAFVRTTALRKDGGFTALPYAGVGYALRFGPERRWDFDSRIGVGPTLNADKNLVPPVVKTGLGYVFGGGA